MANKREEFLKYWDNWHAEWWEKWKEILNGTDETKIKGKIKDWEIPKTIVEFKESQEKHPIWSAFPEPYWMKHDQTKQLAVFLNINPGSPFDYHRFNTDDENEWEKNQNEIPNEKISWEKKYRLKDNDDARPYSVVVRELIIQYNSDVNFWHNNRVNWLRRLLDDNNIELEHIINLDLVPWHTKKAKDIKDYVESNYKLICSNILIPALYFSKSNEAGLKNKVLVYGTFLRDLLSEVVLPPKSKSQKKINHNKRSKFLKESLGIKKEPLTFVIADGTSFKQSMLLYIYRSDYQKSTHFICLVTYTGSGMKFPEKESRVFKFSKDNTSTDANNYVGTFGEFILTDFENL